jgi:hypothetical protein
MSQYAVKDTLTGQVKVMFNQSFSKAREYAQKMNRKYKAESRFIVSVQTIAQKG